jgi:hypothetical protein
VTNEELAIFDLSKDGRGEWVPPIGAMGGPPSHELYRDLVTHARLRLMRDADGAPWVELQDGEHRRAFPVPSDELRAALDRFRMRRNLRPVPAADIEEFARVVEARVSDPDIELPAGPDDGRELPGGTPLEPVSPPESNWAVDELDHLMREVDQIQGRASAVEAEPPRPAAATFGHPAAFHRRLPQRWHMGVSSARAARPGTDPRLPRYIRALRELLQDGSWIGTLSEIGRRTGDDTNEVFSALLQFHTDLVGNDLVVAPVEVEEGWQWVVVDRSRLRGPPGASS